MSRSWSGVPNPRLPSWARSARRSSPRRRKAARSSCLRFDGRTRKEERMTQTRLRRRSGMALFLSVSLVCWASGQFARAEEVPALRLCADPDNLPFSSASEATPGFWIELGREVARALGRPFQPVWVPTYYVKRQVRMKLLAGQCDGFAGLPDEAGFMTPRVVFTRPVLRVGFALVTPPDRTAATVGDLRGRRVA